MPRRWYTTWRQKICVTNLCTRRRSGRNLCTSERRCFDAESFRRPRANDRGSISALFEWRGIGGQRLPPMARDFCTMLSVSTRCRWSPRARHPGAVDVLRPRGLGRVSRRTLLAATFGSTLANLRGWIEHQGAYVIRATILGATFRVSSGNGNLLTLSVGD